MLKHLVILLDSEAPSYCYADNPHSIEETISKENLTKAVRFAMLNGLQIQIVTSYQKLPSELSAALNTVSYGMVGKRDCVDADAIIIEGFPTDESLYANRNIILRMSWEDLRPFPYKLCSLAVGASRLNLVLKDCISWGEKELCEYNGFLNIVSLNIERLILDGHDVQLNVVTDRITLDKPNYCNAGYESITLAPNGKFYICPSFYFAGNQPIGNLDEGINIPNQQLYRPEYAPICQKCDAWQCKRCVWLNQKSTGEVGIPGHEQCVMSHHERNAAQKLLRNIQQKTEYLPQINIEEISYLDPFDLINQI